RGAGGTREPAKKEVRVAGRVADPEALDRLRRDAALGDVGARVGRLTAVREHRPEEFSGLLVGAVEGGPARRGPLLGGRVSLVPETDAGGLREAFDRLDVGQVLQLAEERDRVPALAAAEAVEDLLGRRNAERRGLLLVEGTQPRQGVVTRL